MRFRLLVVARLIGTWAAPLALLGGFGLLTGSWQALWLVELLCVASIPLLSLASLVCFVFARSVASHAFPWTVGALLITLLTGSVLAGTAGGDIFADGIGTGSHAILVFDASMANDSRQHLKSGLASSHSQKSSSVMATPTSKCGLPSKAEGPASDARALPSGWDQFAKFITLC